MLSVWDIVIHYSRIQKTLSEGSNLWQRFLCSCFVFCLSVCLFLWGAQDPTNTISGPSSAHQLTLNGVLLASRWWPNIKCWLGNFVIFQRSRTSVAKKTFIFVSFQGVGVGTPWLPPLDLRKLIRIRIFLWKYSKVTPVLSIWIISLYLIASWEMLFCHLQISFQN